MARKSKSPPSKSRRSPIRWTAQEDGILFKTVHACTIRGEGQSLPSDPKQARKDTIAWKLVAQSLPGRTNRDCRKRWFKIDRRWVQGPWVPDEETRLREAVAIYGPDETSICWQQNPVPWQPELPQVVTIFGQQVMKEMTTLNPTIVPHENSVMLDIYQPPFGQPTSDYQAICGNDCTEQSADPRNSDNVSQISASYMGPIHEESRYVQIRDSSLGYGTLGPGCSSMAVVDSVADQQLGQIVGYMRQQGIQATIHVR
ncbi:hypothetical protein BDV27DRAFT_155062 [Aspergillus caelatus]|uniref:Myb-like domain-containing protein n=1 Tax=Aspergillus caelatus TaxID=61420 RepID=A0A5N7AE56_9EURO|nr:uncharacterized protein BDV27DRAFT_155062 [Aspergillus caelatus]KAE8367359.1 hypothetical protein BDV27DRAFT_155062 [Aspergillus caelatus]